MTISRGDTMTFPRDAVRVHVAGGGARWVCQGQTEAARVPG